ncbi:MAG: hypothetical protein WC375_07610 [Methanomassiliicoccales archaeon]|jgi:hypothetical protein
MQEKEPTRSAKVEIILPRDSTQSEKEEAARIAQAASDEINDLINRRRINEK